MSTNQQDIRDHQNWLGYLQPDGLVVSPAALVDSQIIYDRSVRPAQQEFLAHLTEFQGWEGAEDEPTITDYPAFFTEFLRWREKDFISGDDIPTELTTLIQSTQELLVPTHAVKDPDNAEAYQMLIIETDAQDFDKPISDNNRGWNVSPTKRFERLLRETDVAIGLLCSPQHIRLIYAPAGENPGSITFPVAAMSEIAGRPILGGFKLLLDDYRLFTATEKETLPAILKKSRDFQANVSTDLAAQVLDGLYELLRGLQSAHFKSDQTLLKDTLALRPDAIYEAQLNVLMRLVFLLFAEDRGLMPDSMLQAQDAQQNATLQQARNYSLYGQNYSIHSLYEQLRDDHEKFPDSMDQRYGAWARLLSVFRLVYDGSRHLDMQMPPRLGYLFDYTRFPFLEGRDENQKFIGKGLPRIPDSTIHIVLGKLLYLDGEKLSYRTLDVEQIGSVYETMMGFRLQIADGPTIAIKAKKTTGAATNINLNELLATEPAKRNKWFENQTDKKFTAKQNTPIEAATTEDDVIVALESHIAKNATPQKVQAGALLLQPSDERRKSGSHYTPRKLTEPIVRKALEPILSNLSVDDSKSGPRPSDILNLKVCDPAVGSGAFLVESCRQLGDALVAAWSEHGGKPFIRTDEDELLHARRMVAQRCLYGVDRNPMAADLCKLSLWLATLAKDQPFTFLDHSVRSGDSLVGLTKQQILHFHWDLKHETATQMQLGEDRIVKQLDRALKIRTDILNADYEFLPQMKETELAKADDALEIIRRTGDLCISSFFEADKKNARQERRDTMLDLLVTSESEGNTETKMDAVTEVKKHVTTLKSGEFPVTPFHWEIEFPEVFEKKNSGFDCFVGNPPFVWGNRISSMNGEPYRDWLPIQHPQSHGNSDLCAHFLRLCHRLINHSGTTGLITTNSISESDTSFTGLNYIIENGGCVYSCITNTTWPGQASVRISFVWFANFTTQDCNWNNAPCKQINASARNDLKSWINCILDLYFFEHMHNAKNAS